MAEFAVRQFAITKNIVPFLFYAYIIMPDHVHALIQPKAPHAISQIMHVYKRHLSRNIRILSIHTAAEDGHLPLREVGNKHFAWQKSFHDHVIRDQRDFNHHVNYLHFNPVKDGLVKKPEDRPYSSYDAFLKGDYTLIDAIPK